MYVMGLAPAEPQARAQPEKHHLVPVRRFRCFCGCQSLPRRLSLWSVVAGRGISRASAFQSLSAFKEKKRKYLCQVGVCMGLKPPSSGVALFG